MQAIRAGDLYFLQSPFSSGITKDAAQTSRVEKRLSYLLGTVSSRPAVVIRPPSWWDRYNTVTVIPAINKAKPALIYKLEDRYGFATEADYPFVPHNPHTIPVARLGHYIGSLTSDELAELIYAYKWIHDPLMQEDTTLAVPDIYKDIWNKKNIPPSWKDNRDARADVRIGISPNMVITSETNPELDGFDLSATGIFVDPIPAPPADEFVPTESVLPDSTQTKEEVNMKPIKVKNTVPVEKAFPPSIFSNNDLWKVAARFTIDDKFYDGECDRRDPSVLTGAELDKIFGDAPRHVQDDLMDLYRKMTPFDAFLLGPRLPLQTLCDLLDLSHNDGHMLKMMCNVMRDLGTVEYLTRCEDLKHKSTHADTTVSGGDETVENSKIDMAAAAAHLAKIKPYLSAKSVGNMPEKYIDDFLATPMFMVQRAWKGPQFKTSYQKAISRYTATRKEHKNA